MEYILALIGILLGIWFAKVFGSIALTLISIWRFRGDEGFFLLYDAIDSHEGYEFMKEFYENFPKTYIEFLRMHQECRDQALVEFRDSLRSIQKDIGINYLVAILIPSIALTQVGGMYYLVASTLPIIVFIVYKKLRDNRSASFYIGVLIRSTLNAAIRTTRQARKDE